MAGADDSGAAKEKSTNELPITKVENVQNNAKIIYYSRTFMSIIGGVIAGILGVTGWMGFVCYFLIMAVTSVGLAAKAGFSVHLYFGSWNSILLDGFFGGLMSFVLFWTFQAPQLLASVVVFSFPSQEIDSPTTLSTYSEESCME